MIRLFETLEKLAGELGKTEELQWRHIRQRLPELSVNKNKVLMLSPDESLEKSHRHFSNAMAVSPLGIIDYEGEGKEIIDAVIADYERLGTSQWVGYTFAWMAHLYAVQGNGEKAAEYLMGTHDFSAFTDLKEDKDTVRTIYAVGIVYEKDTLTLSWIGDGFLYHMVRILTGTLLDVGIGKIKAEEIPEILKAKDRKKSGFPAPAKGLLLGRVFYTEAELKKAVQKIS